MRLSCKVPHLISEEIELLRIDHDLSKARALHQLIELAVCQPDFQYSPVEGEPAVNCTVDLPEREWDRFREYRKLHRLVTKVAFFQDALARGAAIYRAHPDKIGSGGERDG